MSIPVAVEGPKLWRPLHDLSNSRALKENGANYCTASQGSI
jgi:hypothetical protein